MASIILSSVGSTLGNRLLPGIGGRLLGYVGRRLGKWVDSELGISSSSSSSDGPRLESISVQNSRYGGGIPYLFGSARVAGNVIWASDLIETSHESSSGIGKGGVVSSVFGSTRTTYTYSLHCAVAIAQGPIGGIATIWADSKVVYQNGAWKSGIVGSATFHLGGDDQGVDSFMESQIGSGQVPAYRGIAYVVLESLQLSNFGSRLPNLTFEVLPVDTSVAPTWLGYNKEAQINQILYSLRNKGMPPLVVEGSSYRAKKVLIGGYLLEDTTATFQAIVYDVTGDAPEETARAQSAGVTVVDVGDLSWAMAPDERFVAAYMQSTDASPTHHFILFDTQTLAFGEPLALSLGSSSGGKQIAWIDAQHFAITDAQDGVRGVRVFARSGSNVLDLGFHGVWGANSSTTRIPLMYAQFTATSSGLLNYMADSATKFTAIYVRSLVWQDNALYVGDAYTLTSGYSTGTGSGPACYLLATGDEEWTLFYSTVVDMRMMSFVPGASSATITRPWQTLTNASLSVSTSCHPIVMGDRLVVAQRASTDVCYRLSEIALNEGSFALVTDGVTVQGFSAPVSNFAAAYLDPSRLLLLGVSGFYYTLSQIAIIRLRTTGSTLDAIVASILERAGYEASDYDVSALADVEVDGYVVSEAMTAQAALTPLQYYEPFDLIESDGVLKAVKRSIEPSMAIDPSEGRAVSGDKAEILPLRELSRAQETDLPLEIQVDFLDAASDYETGSQRARRGVTKGARIKSKIELPIVCTATKAKQIAELRLYTLWSEREQARVRWSRRWLAVEPGDVVDMGQARMRVTKIRSDKGVLEVTGVIVPSLALASSAQAQTSSLTTSSQTLQTVASVLYLMDLPLLRSDDDQPGVYVAASGLDGWSGATVWRSLDGVNYSQALSAANAATSGIATSALEDAPSAYPDNAHEVSVQLLQGSLESSTLANLLNGANVALLGDEIVQFQNATLLGPGLYRLSGLLRGRRGTEAATTTHAVGERFVVLTESAVQFLPAALTDRGVTYQFRALSNGQDLGDGADHAFTYELGTLRPLSPAHVVAARESGVGSALTLSWKRRARKNAQWLDYIDVPLDETTELYDVEIMNGSTMMRTFADVAATTQIYTAEQQLADWGQSVPSSFTVNVYQRSVRYGRGDKASAVV